MLHRDYKSLRTEIILNVPIVLVVLNVLNDLNVLNAFNVRNVLVRVADNNHCSRMLRLPVQPVSVYLLQLQNALPWLLPRLA